MSDRERRVHARVQVAADVRVSGPQGVENGTLKDISKGGAAAELPGRVGVLGDVVEIFIAFPAGAEIAVMAEIVRLVETPQGLVHGFRFSLVEPSMQDTLLKLIETLLTSKGSTTRRYPRIAHRIPVRCRAPTELQSILENISMGGLAMNVPFPLVLYQEVEVSVPDSAGRDLLLLKGRVVNQHPVGTDGRTHRVGLEFKDLSPVAKACLAALISDVLELRKK